MQLWPPLDRAAPPFPPPLLRPCVGHVAAPASGAPLGGDAASCARSARIASASAASHAFRSRLGEPAAAALGLLSMGPADGEDWAAGEVATFVAGLRTDGRDFPAIARRLPHKDVRRVVGFYYNVWKARKPLCFVLYRLAHTPQHFENKTRRCSSRRRLSGTRRGGRRTTPNRRRRGRRVSRRLRGGGHSAKRRPRSRRSNHSRSRIARRCRFRRHRCGRRL